MTKKRDNHTLIGSGECEPCMRMGTFTPGLRIPEPEVRHIIMGEEGLVVLEYPDRLSHDRIERIKADWQGNGRRPVVLDGGARLKILSPKPGDAIVVETNHRLSEEDNARVYGCLKEILEGKGVTVPVLIAEKGVDIRTADEETMRQMGWVRAEE